MKERKCMGVEKLSDNPFLNLYHIDARTVSGKPFDYYFASRNKENEIKIKTKEESISEEMRILYVALTRAKEKLIITGVESDLEKSLEQKKELVQIYERENGKINHLLLKKYLSYLGWIELTYMNHENIEDYIELKKINKKDIIKQDEELEEKADNKLQFSEDIDYKKINEILNWKYEYEEMTNIQSKMSVTKIKELKENIKKRKVEIKPKFTIESTTVSAAEKGTIIHLILQKLDFTKDYTKNELSKFIEDMCNKNLITENQKDAIDIDKIYKIIESDFIKNLKSAKEIHKETPFYTYINTKEIYNTENSENILVQGIIDLYYINQNDELILVDYKTDYTQDEGKDLVDKYKVQLEIYKKALEEALKIPVKETYIYSIYANKAINLEKR